MSVQDNSRRIGQLETRLVVVEDRVISGAGLVSMPVCDERYGRIMDSVDAVTREALNLRTEATNYRRQRAIQTIGILSTLAIGLALLALRLLGHG